MDAYIPSAEEKNDPDLYASNVRSHMAKAMSLPTTDHTYPDLFFQVHILKQKYLVEHDFTLRDVKSKTGLELDDLKVVSDRFREVNKGIRTKGVKGANLTIEEFDLGLKISEGVMVVTQGKTFEKYVGAREPIKAKKKAKQK